MWYLSLIEFYVSIFENSRHFPHSARGIPCRFSAGRI
jgi:hypothetical protein